MNFLNDMYEKEVREELFKGDTRSERVQFQAFIDFVDSHSKHEHTAQEFETELTVFDDDRNGEAAFTDIIRVLREYGKADDAEIAQLMHRIM